MSWRGRRRTVRRHAPRIAAVLDIDWSGPLTAEHCPGTAQPVMFARHGRGICCGCEQPVNTTPSPDGRPGDVAAPHRSTP